jgi:hypothetical protein
MASCWTFSQHFPTPTFCIHGNQINPNKKSHSQPFWMFYTWTHLPFSNTTMSAHAFSSPKKIIEFGCIPSCCICPNSSITSYPCPHFTCPNIMVVELTTFWKGISWTFSKHSLGSHILHTCPPSYSLSNLQPLLMIY